jgi:hypothetical protein
MNKILYIYLPIRFKVPIAILATLFGLQDRQSFGSIREVVYVAATQSYQQRRHRKRHKFSQ